MAEPRANLLDVGEVIRSACWSTGYCLGIKKLNTVPGFAWFWLRIGRTTLLDDVPAATFEKIMKLLSAAQVSVDVGDPVSAAVEIVQTGLAPATVLLLARRLQPLAVDTNVLAREPVIAGRYSASLRAVQTTVIVDDLAAAVARIQRS